MKFSFRNRKTQNQARISKEVRNVLGFKPKNIKLYELALRHKSYSKSSRKKNNERLEYLGDAVIGVIVADYLFQKYPDKNEGELTKMRSRMVSRKHLNELADKIGLGSAIPFRKQYDLPKEHIQGNVFEALFGAIYLDGGFSAAKECLLSPRFAKFIQEITDEPEDVNPKGQLQEILQAISTYGPSYRIISQEVPDHRKEFVAEVVWNGTVLGNGIGNSKKEAEIAAASQAMAGELWKPKNDVENP